jgi:hypothetical protein
MPALLPRATPIHDTARLRILEAYRGVFGYYETAHGEDGGRRPVRREDALARL